MTVKQLHIKLCEMLANGQADMKVCVATHTFRNTGGTVLDVHGAAEQMVPESDANGKYIIDKNGFTKHGKYFVLFGFIP